MEVRVRLQCEAIVPHTRQRDIEGLIGILEDVVVAHGHGESLDALLVNECQCASISDVIAQLCIVVSHAQTTIRQFQLGAARVKRVRVVVHELLHGNFRCSIHGGPVHTDFTTGMANTRDCNHGCAVAVQLFGDEELGSAKL